MEAEKRMKDIDRTKIRGSCWYGVPKAEEPSWCSSQGGWLTGQGLVSREGVWDFTPSPWRVISRMMQVTPLKGHLSVGWRINCGDMGEGSETK